MTSPKNDDKHKSPRKNSTTLDSLSEAYREISPYLNISYFFLASIGLLSWIGHLLDNSWGTDPWGLVTGALLGIVVGFYHFFKTVSKSSGNGKD